jgi:hypothetical protein
VLFFSTSGITYVGSAFSTRGFVARFVASIVAVSAAETFALAAFFGFAGLLRFFGDGAASESESGALSGESDAVSALCSAASPYSSSPRNAGTAATFFLPVRAAFFAGVSGGGDASEPSESAGSAYDAAWAIAREDRRRLVSIGRKERSVRGTRSERTRAGDRRRVKAARVAERRECCAQRPGP